MMEQKLYQQAANLLLIRLIRRMRPIKKQTGCGKILSPFAQDIQGDSQGALPLSGLAGLKSRPRYPLFFAKLFFLPETTLGQ